MMHSNRYLLYLDVCPYPQEIKKGTLKRKTVLNTVDKKPGLYLVAYSFTKVIFEVTTSSNYAQNNNFRHFGLVGISHYIRREYLVLA